MKILIAGDYSPAYRIQKIIEEESYKSIFEEIRAINKNVDYSIVNFESCIPSKNDLPIVKCGPHLKCGSNSLDAIKWAGFNCLTLANNHFFDYGQGGVERTLSEVKARAIDYVGGGENIQKASKILYKTIRSETLAIINACEHEFSIATDSSGGSNPLNIVNLYYSIQEAKSKADFVIAIIHGGHEYFQLPSPRMQETYRYFIDVGADAVINHHQHCINGYEIYKGRPIFYGIGNFCFDNREYRGNTWNQGFLVILSLEHNIHFDLIPFTQCDKNPRVEMLSGDKFQCFIQELDNLNNIICNSCELKMHHKKWMDQTSSTYEQYFKPWDNRWIKALNRRGLWPSLLSKKRLLAILNYVYCESHRDRTVNMLYNLINKKQK